MCVRVRGDIFGALEWASRAKNISFMCGSYVLCERVFVCVGMISTSYRNGKERGANEKWQINSLAANTFLRSLLLFTSFLFQ